MKDYRHQMTAVTLGERCLLPSNDCSNYRGMLRSGQLRALFAWQSNNHTGKTCVSLPFACMRNHTPTQPTVKSLLKRLHATAMVKYRDKHPLSHPLHHA
jgi:hypothetical protein